MQSILGQTRTDWELIICDSYSNDGSWEYLQRFREDPRVHLFQAPRLGCVPSLNQCLRQANGEYIYVAPSDDTAHPTLLERLTAPLERFKHLSIAVCDYDEINIASCPIPQRPRYHEAFFGKWLGTPSIRNGQTEFLLHSAFGGTLWCAISAILFRRSLLDVTGLFPEWVGPRADEAWTLRACLATDIAWVPGKWVSWRRHPCQLTQSTPDAARIVLACINSVLNDDQAGIPSAWKTVKNWRTIIAATHLQNYHNSLKLYRWEAKQNPHKFLCNCYRALCSDPQWLLHQLRHAFGVVEEDQEVDPSSRAKDLISLFHTPWPPTPVPDGW